MTTYEVIAERDRLGWVLHVPAVNRVTQARHLREAETMARDLVVLMTGTRSAGVDIHIRFELGDSVTKHLAESRRLRQFAKDADAQATAEARAAAAELATSGVSLRDIGEIMGVSYQRVHQLVTA